MKSYLIIAVLTPLCFSCEKKETVINPPAEVKHETTIVNPPASEKTIEKKTETETKILPGGTTTEKKETTTEQR